MTVASHRPRKTNAMAIIAFVMSIIGFVFACMPGALLLGWILLPIAFLLSIISFFLAGRGKGFGIAALIISVVGTIVGVLVFLFVVATSFDEAFNPETTTVEESSDEQPVMEDEGDDVAQGADEDPNAAQETEDEAAASAEQGSRANPYALGTTVESGDWELTVKSVDVDATDEVMAENPYNEEPGDGNQYLMASIELTYIGDDPQGAMPETDIRFVTAEGNTVDGYDSIAVVPDQLDEMTTLYEGATESGNIAFSVPSKDVENGEIVIAPTYFGDDVFFSVK